MWRTRATLRTLIALWALPLIGGCVVGPNYQRPATPPAQAYSPAPLPASTASTAGIAVGAAQRFSTATLDLRAVVDVVSLSGAQ